MEGDSFYLTDRRRRSCFKLYFGVMFISMTGFIFLRNQNEHLLGVYIVQRKLNSKLLESAAPKTMKRICQKITKHLILHSVYYVLVKINVDINSSIPVHFARYSAHS